MKKVLVLFLLLSSLLSFSQSYEEYEVKYKEAKALFDLAKYDEAKTAFDQVSAKVDYNPFMPYARFYKSVCYKKLGGFSESRFVLNKLLEDVNRWSKNDFVYYLLAEVNYELGDFSQAQEATKDISDETLKHKAQEMFYHFVAKETDLEKLKLVQAENKKDDKVAKICAFKISSDTTVDARFFLEYLVQDYELEGFSTAKKGELKDSYKVAVMIPFGAKEHKAFKRTKFLDLFHGIMLAKDTLKAKGVDLEFEIFDTKRSVAHVQSIVDNPSFKEFDLILGPLFSGTSKIVAEFAEENQILMFNLLNRSDEISKEKMFVYSSLATYSLEGKRLAEQSVVIFDTTKAVRVYYHHDRKHKTDSIIARAYKDRLVELGIKVSLFKKVSRNSDDIDDYRQSLEWTTETNTDHVAIFAKKNNLMASTLISVWETRDKKIPVLVSSEWMKLSLINYEQFVRRNIHFYAPEFVDASEENVKSFQQAYKKKMSIKPMELESASLGYDLTLLCGFMLKEYGTFFHQNFNEMNHETTLLKGLNYNGAYGNTVVPIIKFDEDLNLIIVNTKATNEEK